MENFEIFSSNTIAGSANQYYFLMSENEVRTGRVFYKITHGGTYRYSLMFSNSIDSTYADGSVSFMNMLCKPWTVHSARVGKVCASAFDSNALQHNDADVSEWFDLTFEGKRQKNIASGELFWSDPIEMAFVSGEYLCMEVTFSGAMLPYHEESLLPAFVLRDGNWIYDKKTPFAGMIGCDRHVDRRITFLGDSITQGIGTPINSYAHWNALLADRLGKHCACWNLGIGYARAHDAASMGTWWTKAKHSDIAVVCLGANDILQNYPEQQIKQDIATVVMALKNHNIRVVLQTIPPFEYQPNQIETWKHINAYIKSSLAAKVDLLFDVVPYLSNGEPDHLPKYGGHPNESGCRIWAEALYEQLQMLL